MQLEEQKSADSNASNCARHQFNANQEAAWRFVTDSRHIHLFAAHFLGHCFGLIPASRPYLTNQLCPSWSRIATCQPSVISAPFFPSSNSNSASTDHLTPSSHSI